ncbi:hypothetical protein O6P37_16530 [Mycobacterium sp. CPCC 205372]|uniref:LuxR family transcriptional regulator n=1 Tax=Mycobacterium hippophais TaxID=3016340 RepID=A0ABT4PV76_9MYCO|nr:hypothetical protein [Mycobacterium hippophais]MCZ8380474.1 hypothetical protein [Mycobacterium hippophais]
MLSEGLIAYHESAGDGLAGSAGHYIRALAQLMRGQLDPCVDTLERLWEHPADWERYGALASLDVIAYGVGCHAYALRGDLDAAESAIARGVALGGARNDGFGTAVVRTAAVQLSAMLGELTELGVEQFIPGAQLIRGWALATGPDSIDTTEDMHHAIAAHARGWTTDLLAAVLRAALRRRVHSSGPGARSGRARCGGTHLGGHRRAGVGRNAVRAPARVARDGLTRTPPVRSPAKRSRAPLDSAARHCQSPDRSISFLSPARVRRQPEV